jgi:molybdopterin synthase sulfur carrier subunit
VKLTISSHLAEYTAGHYELAVSGGTLDAALHDLDRQYPGIRFRFVDEQDQVREHFNVYVNKKRVKSLSVPLAPGDEIHVLAALSGG